MNRRQYLKLVGGIASAGSLAGCGGQNNPQPGPTERSPSASPTPTGTPTATTTAKTTTSTETNRPVPEAPASLHGIRFERVRHAVDDLGMDPTGKQPIDGALDSAYRDGTLVVFPPGNYLAKKQHVWEEGANGFGLLGLGSSHTDVQFVFPKGNRDSKDPANHWFLRANSGRDHLLENFTVQQTRDKVTGVGTVFFLEDGLQVHDIEFAGFNPMWSHDPGFAIVAAMTTREGVGVIRRFKYVGGGVVATYPKRKIPIASYANHRGELRILQPHIAESGEHSMYVSRTPGCVRVEDGLFVNNDNSNLRMSGGGHPTKRSWAKNCRIVIDVDSAKHLPKGENYQGCRGIWVESGGEHKYGYSGLLLENISVEMRSNASPLPLLLLQHSHGALTVRNCQFRSIVEGANPIDALYPKKYVAKPYGLTLEDVSVRTSATTVANEYAVALSKRPGSAFRNLTVELAPGQVNGILLDDSNGTRIVDSDIAVRSSGLRHEILTASGNNSTVGSQNDVSNLESAENSLGENAGIVVKGTDTYDLKNTNINVPGERIRVVNTTPTPQSPQS